LLGLQYSQGQKSAQTEKYGSIKGLNLMNLCPVYEEDTNLNPPSLYDIRVPNREWFFNFVFKVVSNKKKCIQVSKFPMAHNRFSRGSMFWDQEWYPIKQKNRTIKVWNSQVSLTEVDGE
jgi:hypothetical protein